jgi:hypothetical protein
MQLPPELFEEILAFTRPDPHEDMREAPRIPLTATIVAQPAGGGCGGDVRVHVRDMSPEGMGVMSTRPFEVGQRFVVILPRGTEPQVTIVCEVRHCTRVADAIYHVGVLFLDGGGNL